MAQHQSRKPEEEHRWVQEKLRSLRKVSAPWYFESELQRRLHEEKVRAAKPAWLRSPVPAYGLSALAVLAIGVVGYFMAVRGYPPVQQSVPVRDLGKPTRQVAPSTPSVRSEAEKESQEIRQAPPRELKDLRSGPSSPAAGAAGETVPRRIVAPPERSRAGEVGQHAIESVRGQGVLQVSPAVALPTTDTARRSDSTRRPADSLRVRADTSRPAPNR